MNALFKKATGAASNAANGAKNGVKNTSGRLKNFIVRFPIWSVLIVLGILLAVIAAGSAFFSSKNIRW